ncbi:hypothetical protein QQF64_019590, partial [Cirrhinus molitorella]
TGSSNPIGSGWSDVVPCVCGDDLSEIKSRQHLPRDLIKINYSSNREQYFFRFTSSVRIFFWQKWRSSQNYRGLTHEAQEASRPYKLWKMSHPLQLLA